MTGTTNIDDKIQAALEARKARTSSAAAGTTNSTPVAAETPKTVTVSSQTGDSKIQAALAARSERLQSALPDVLTDLQKNLNTEIERYNSVQQPAFNSYSETATTQAESRGNIGSMRNTVNTYRSYLPEGTADEILSVLDQMESGYDAYLNMSSFESQDAWDQAVREYGYQQKYLGKSVADLNAAIEGLEDGEEKDWLANNKYLLLTSNQGFAEAAANRDFSNPTMDDLEYYDAMMDYSNWKTNYVTGEMTDAFGNIIDPNNVDASGSILHPLQNASRFTISDPLGLFLSATEQEIEEGYNTENVNSIWGSLAKKGVENNWKHLTESETNIYYALLNSEGIEAALQFLDDWAETLNYREGAQQAKKIKAIDNNVLRTLSMGIYGLEAGADQFKSGIGQLVSDQAQPTSAKQYGSSLIADSLDGLGKYAYEATTVVGNMLPSIAMAYLTGGVGLTEKVAKGVGAATMGVSAAGNAYGQALAEGYDKGQARVYGTLVGVSEAVLQDLIGGIGKLGGGQGLTNKILSKVGAIDNAFVRIAAKLGADIADEITEEELQNFLEPAFRTIIFGEDYDAPTIQEILETAIVTAISTPAMSGGTTIANDLLESKYYKDLYGNVQQELVAKGLESPDGSLSNTLAAKYQKKLDAGKKLSGYQLGRMVKANEQQFKVENQQEVAGVSLPTLEDDGKETGGEVSAEAMRTQAYADFREGRITEAEFEAAIDEVMHMEELEDGTSVKHFDVMGEGTGLQSGVINAQTENINENVNGGTVNDSTERGSTGIATARAAGGRQTGEGVLYGSGQRNDGPGTGEQTGGLAESAEQRQKDLARVKSTLARENLARSLRLEKVSSLDLGLETGTETKNIQVMPQEHWDEEMAQLDNRIFNETGKHITFVLGKIQIQRADGKEDEVRGVINGDQILVQVDNARATMEQIADHEAYHAKVDFSKQNGLQLNENIRQHIIDTFGEEQLNAVLDEYVAALLGVYSAKEGLTGEEFEEAVRIIEEELFADAYAGINAFGANASQFTDAVNERMVQLDLGKTSRQENGTAEPTGPPADGNAAYGERFSYEGESVGEGSREGEEDIPGLSLPTLEDLDAESSGQKENTARGGVRYSIDERFGSLIDNWDGNTTGFSFVVGETSNALQEAGIPKKQIRWDASKIKTLLGKHNGMTMETVKQIPELLENPIIVIDSKKGSNSKIVMGDLYDEHGNIVTAVILLTPTSKKGNVLDFLKISSAEGRSHINSLFAYEDGTPVAIRYVDKNRIQSWLNVNRLQLPLHNLDLDSNTIIDDSGTSVKEKDAAYLDAVQQGNIETAQRMVDDAVEDDDIPRVALPSLDDYEQETAVDITQEVSTTENGASPFKTGTRKGNPSGDTPSALNIRDRIRNVKAENRSAERYSVDDMEENTDIPGLSLPTLEDLDEENAVGNLDNRGQNGVKYSSKVKEGEKTDYDQRRIQRNARQASGSPNESAGVSVFGRGDRVDGRADGKSKAWRNLNRRSRELFRRTVETAVNTSHNYDELRMMLAKIAGKPAADMSLADKTAAIESMAEQIYSDIATYESAALAENNWRMLGDIKPIIEAFDRIQTGNGKAERYSVDESSGVRANMTTKERDILRGVENRLLRDIGSALGATKFADRGYIKEVIRDLSDSYLETGTIDNQEMDKLFAKAYDGSIVVDREFHDQYEEVRKYLHTMPITLDARDRSNIADYEDFIKQVRNRLRITDKGGLPVDSAYQELNTEAPELFPESIVHPADRLVRMAEVWDSLRIAERSLNEYYGPSAEAFRRMAREEFDRAVWDSIGELRQIRRFTEEKQQQRAEHTPTTPEEAMEAWAKLKTARKTYEKAMAKHLLTESDEIQVGRLLRGEILPEQLVEGKDYVKGIIAVYEAKQEYETLTKLLAEYRKKVRADLRAEADTYLETANAWKDKKAGIAYSRETMQRNVEDIVPDKTLAKAINEKFFEPVRDAEAAAVKLKNMYRERMRALNISRSVEKGNLVSEAHAAQLYGEAMDNIRVLEKAGGRVKQREGKTLEEWRSVVYKLWQENPGLDKSKIENAVIKGRQIYDELLQLMNEVRVRWGYEPVNYHQGYFPHFQPGNGDGIIAQFGRALGIDTQVVALPTTINGLTHTFKPGIQWFGNAQERLGFNTAYDMIEGFDRYIEGVASIICQTENIQKLRAFATQIRYRTSDEGIRKQVDAVYANPELTEEQKNSVINDIYEHGRFTLANFVVEVDEYTNLLANKKSKLDRTVEAMLDRKFYTLMKWLESRVGANMIAGNLASALTNFIPLTQAGAQLSKKAMLRGMWDTLCSYRTDDGIIGMSAFLTNRHGSDPLVKSWSAKTAEILGKPMELIDGFVSGSIVRAAYRQNLKRGMSENEAMHQADIFASRVMAERSKGGMPTLFESQNPLVKAATQFQLEVNNQFSEVFKDIPRAYRGKGLGALMLVLLQYFLAAWLFNNEYEKLIGRRPAMDPIDILLDTGRDLLGPERVGIGEAGKNLANNILDELPFVSVLTLIGIDTDAGRIPVSSAIPDLNALWDAATTEGWSAEKRWKEAQDELNKLAYALPPFGGNQASKIWKGIKAYIEGGSYSVNTTGDEILQYPVYNDEEGDFWSLVRAMLFGKSSLPEAQEWVDDGFDSLSVKETTIYQDMLDAGVSGREAYKLIDDLRTATATKDKNETEVQIDILLESEASDHCKAIAFYGLLATDAERPIMDELTDAGAQPDTAMDVIIKLRSVKELPAAEEKAAQADILINSDLSEDEKAIVIRTWLDDKEISEKGNLTNLGKFNMAMKLGISTEKFLRCRQIGVSIDKLIEYAEAGLDPEDAADLVESIDTLKPEDGQDRVSDIQKWRLSVDYFSNADDQLTALSMVMSDSQMINAEVANDFDVMPDVFVSFYEKRVQYDADGNGSFKQEEIKATIDAEFNHLNNSQKAVLWQIFNSSAKNNPYSQEVGQRVLDTKAAMKSN